MGFFGLLLIGGGLVAYVLMTDEPPVGQEAQAGQVPLDHRVTMPLEPFLVNLADKESRRYLKLKLALEVDSEESQKELEKFLPHIRDGLILLLSSYTAAANNTGRDDDQDQYKRRHFIHFCRFPDLSENGSSVTGMSPVCRITHNTPILIPGTF